MEKNNHLKVSVITPSYNQAQYLEKTINSVLEQKYKNIEYIVIDGGSTDGSVEIIRQYQHKLAYWKSEKDKGQSDAIKQGFALSTGDILCWINSDDMFLPDAIEKVVNFFVRHHDVEAISAGGYYINKEGIPITRGFGSCTLGVSATYNRLRFYEQDGVFQQSTFWKRSAYEAVGGIDESLHFIMDRDLFTRLAKRRQFARFPTLVAVFRLHDECKSMRLQKTRELETIAYLDRYGVAGHVRIIRMTLYAYYRVPSLIRKFSIKVRLMMGLIKQ